MGPCRAREAAAAPAEGPPPDAVERAGMGGSRDEGECAPESGSGHAQAAEQQRSPEAGEDGADDATGHAQEVVGEKRRRRVSFAQGPLGSADGHPQHECAGARQVRWVTSPPRLPTMKEIERDRRELGAEFVDSHMRRIVQRRSQRRAKAAARPSSDGGASASSPPTAPLTSSASGDDHRKGEQQPSLFALAFKS
eukprot:PRCOL_00002977-RA